MTQDETLVLDTITTLQVCWNSRREGHPSRTDDDLEPEPYKSWYRATSGHGSGDGYFLGEGLGTANGWGSEQGYGHGAGLASGHGWNSPPGSCTDPRFYQRLR